MSVKPAGFRRGARHFVQHHREQGTKALNGYRRNGGYGSLNGGTLVHNGGNP